MVCAGESLEKGLQVLRDEWRECELLVENRMKIRWLLILELKGWDEGCVWCHVAKIVL